jgi:hypothetical protein
MRSYPFGRGDSSWRILELEDGVTCQRGSGCISGWGSVVSVGLEVGEVFAAIVAELLSWIHGADDPLISRRQHVWGRWKDILRRVGFGCG